MATHQFPLDLEDTKYEARISFTARKIKAFDVDFLFGGSVRSLEARGVDPALANAVRRRDLQGEQPKNQTVPGSKQEFEPGNEGSCSLYLPQAIQITDAASYDNVDLGILGAGTAAGMQEGAAMLPALVDNAASGFNSVIDAATGRSAVSQDVARLAVNRAAKFLPSGEARGAVRSTTRVSVNPNTRALFKSVPLREFAFNFKMIPTSKEETIQIQNIIEFFRTQLYPEVIPLGDINAGYKFPNVFEINMKYKNKKDLATKILPSYIRSFSATYNSSSMGFYEGGDFSEVDISMAFIESSTLHKALIQEGY